MESVARTAPAPATAAELARAGVRVTVVSEGLTAPRVDVVAPAALAPALRAAIGWRLAAMAAQHQAAARTESRAWALPTLVAVPGLRGPRAGACPSCGEPHDARHASSDCILCVAARIGALRQLGRLGPALPSTPPARTSLEAWLGQDRGREPGVVLPRAVYEAWACAKCSTRVEHLPDPDLECGPCQIKRQSVVDTSRLGGLHA